MLRAILDFFSSLRLTVACLGAAMVVVFTGTIAQVNGGIHEVQKHYFQSLFIHGRIWGHDIPLFPGGHLLIAILLVNLVTAHARRFRWSRSKIGIHLIHGGLIVMLSGVMLTDFLATESFMKLTPGDTRSYSEDQLLGELAVSDVSDGKTDTVTAIPEHLLGNGAVIAHESLPFRIRVLEFHPNSMLQPLQATGGTSRPAATQGVGTRLAVSGLPRVTAPDQADVKSAVIGILPSDGSPSPGTWLVCTELGAPQDFSFHGKRWRLALRQARYYKPFSLTLRSFTHDLYPGTQIPKNFASRARLEDPSHREDREVVISMNRPLRYRGETFYQSGFLPGDAGTILQVVHNPGFIAPYLGCLLVGAGMLWQFVHHFLGFLARRRAA